MELIIQRHGATVGNREGRYVGRTDEPLSSEFISGVGAIEGDFSVSKVFVSPLMRARQTAQILYPNAGHTIVEGFCEMDFGDFEGRTSKEMENDEAYRSWVEGNCEGPCPNGEDINGFRERVCRTFEELALKEAKDGNERLVIVAHGGTIMAIMSRFCKLKKPYFDWFVPNCHGWRASIEISQPGNEIVLSGCIYI